LFKLIYIAVEVKKKKCNKACVLLAIEACKLKGKMKEKQSLLWMEEYETQGWQVKAEGIFI
jgi:hypothetical protein